MLCELPRPIMGAVGYMLSVSTGDAWAMLRCRAASKTPQWGGDFRDPQSGGTGTPNILNASKGIAHVPTSLVEPPRCSETRPYGRFTPPPPSPAELQYE